MKLFKKIRKGFTLIELVVVIAVIAILSAVSVVSYISITNRAKQSNDQQRVDQMNLAMKAAEISKKPSTMHEALQSLKDEGFVAENLKAESNKSEFAYSMSKNKFVILENASKVSYPSDMKGVEKSGDLWRFTKSASGLNDGFSYYLLNDVSGDVEASAGVDVGENDDISSIKFVSSKNETVVIRTNGGNLTINAPEGIVKHYGDGIVLKISAIAGDSYHEYGYFPKASIEKGRLVVEDKGNIPSVEITAVPTQAEPIKVETNKDIVVSASPEVVAQLGSDTLENVEVKVTSAEAAVVVDEKIDSSNVDAQGKTAEDIVRIAKVANYSDLESAITAQKSYIMFTNNISYSENGTGLINICHSTTVDGSGYTLSGYGARGSQNTTVALGFNGTKMIDVTFKDLIITNPGAKGRPLEARGNLNSLTLDNVVINATGTGNNQAITLGGSQSVHTKLSLSKTTINANASGYPIIAYNPFDAVITDSYFNGYCGFYLYGPNGSVGTSGSSIVAASTTFNSPNAYSYEGANSFGVFAFAGYSGSSVNNVKITLNNCKVNVEQTGTAYQALTVFTSGYSYEGNVLTINGSESFINGYLSLNGILAQESKIVLNGGTFTLDPVSAESDVKLHPISELGSGKSVSSTSEFMYVVQ